jgi:hypothetical protein
MLLRLTAEIEHALLVQYLFAAYSLETADSGAALLRRTIVQIAREEMAHLASMQNLLALLGARPHLHRDDRPFGGSDHVPFRFKLEPLTLDSLAKYVAAEAPPPEEWPEDTLMPRPGNAFGSLQDEILARALRSNGMQPVWRVEQAFVELSHRFEQPAIESSFEPAALARQLTTADWGYDRHSIEIAARPEERAPHDRFILGELPVGSPAALRSRALAIIGEIGTQGEDPDPGEPTTLSHFERFLEAFRVLEGTEPRVRPVATDPSLEGGGTSLTSARARRWAMLSDLRYRRLLETTAHFADFDGVSYEADGARTARGWLVLAAFDEMRRLRKVSDKLTQLPISDERSHPVAGSPFTCPRLEELPPPDGWAGHVRTLERSLALVHEMREADPRDRDDPFLKHLENADGADLAAARACRDGAPLPSIASRFARVVLFLEEAMRGATVEAEFHQSFWRDLTRDEFLANPPPQPPFPATGLPIVDLAVDPWRLQQDPEAWMEVTLLAVLRMGGMPKGRPPLAGGRWRQIFDWIRDGCPDGDPAGAVGLVSEPDPTPEPPSI